MFKSEVKRWNRDVEKINNKFEGTFSDPFNISTPTPEFHYWMCNPNLNSNSLTRMLKKRCTMTSAFLHEELNISEEGKTQKHSYDLLKSKAKTMSELKKSVKIHKNISLSGGVMYLRLMSVNALKNINSENFLWKIFPCYLICLPINMHKITFYTETCGTLNWG